eukprot:6059526-Prymnesium_polylepis.1
MFRPVLGTLGDLQEWRKIADARSGIHRIVQPRRRVHVQPPRYYKAATTPGDAALKVRWLRRVRAACACLSVPVRA